MSRSAVSRGGDRPPTPGSKAQPGGGSSPAGGGAKTGSVILTERPATAADLPGAFHAGKRVLTPSGKFLPRTRPISQLAARLRGVCTTSQEDLKISTTPQSVSCGSPTLARQQLCSRGRAISTPPGTFGRSQISKQQKTVLVPKLAGMEKFLTEAAKLTNRPESFRLKTTPGCTPNAVRAAFGEAELVDQPGANINSNNSSFDPSNRKKKSSTNNAGSTGNASAAASGVNNNTNHGLHMWWQNKVLQSGRGPQDDPSILCGIENITEAEQLPRAATLLHALLTFNAKIDAGMYPVVVENNELVGLQPLHRLCRHTRVVEHNEEYQNSATGNPHAAGGLTSMSASVVGGGLGLSKRLASSFSGRGVSSKTRAKELMNKISTVERLHYYEGAKHIIVSRGPHLYTMDIQDASGRILESAELLEGFKLIQEDYQQAVAAAAADAEKKKLRAASGASGGKLTDLVTTSLTRMTFLEAGEFVAMKEEVKAECKSNAMCIESLEGALLHLELSPNGAETAEDPTLAIPSQAWFHGSVLSLHVYPNGNAVLKSSALTLDANLLMHVASSIAHDANCDPMLEYVPEPAVIVQATRLIVRAPSPQVGKKPAKKAVEVVDEVLVQEMAVKLPPPEPAALPKRLPLWMPSSYHQKVHENLQTGWGQEVAAPGLYNFTVQLKHEASLHTAILLALKYQRSHIEFPLLHVVKHAAVRDPTLELCVTNEVESALRHLSSFMAPCGPLKTEVERVCGKAVNSLTALLKDGTPHVSNFARMLHMGLLDPSVHKPDVFDGELLGRADMHITRHPYNPDIMWCLRSPTWVDPSQKSKALPPPMVSYTIVPASRSSLRTALGALCNCSLAVASGDSMMPPEECEKFIGTVKQFVKFVDNCAEQEKKNGPVAKPFALRRIL